MGEQIQNFSFPVCNKFRPKILNGQLCYEVDVNGIEVKDKTTEADLIFLLDYNDDRNDDISFSSKETLNTKAKSLHKLKENDANKLEAMIYIETIGRERMLCEVRALRLGQGA